MIDLASETVVSLSEGAESLPKRRRGKKPHVATLYRWANRGLRGVKLETIQVGGTLCTSVEALQRFFERLAKSTSVPTARSPCARRRTREKATRELERLRI